MIGLGDVSKTMWLGHKIVFLNSPLRNALLTSICHNFYPIIIAILNMTWMAASLTTGLNISLQSRPGHWLYPLATKQVLNLSPFPSYFLFILNIHLQPTGWQFEGEGTKSHVLYCISAVSSFNMASQHCGWDMTWLTLVGSMVWERECLDMEWACLGLNVYWPCDHCESSVKGICEGCLSMKGEGTRLGWGIVKGVFWFWVLGSVWLASTRWDVVEILIHGCLCVWNMEM